MSTSRALVVTPTSAEVLLTKINKFNAIFEQRSDGLISLHELSGVPTFHEIIMSKAFHSVRKKNPDIDIYEMKERDLAIQNYILGRFLKEVKDCTAHLQRSMEYINVMKTFDRYGIDASVYLGRIEDKSARNEASNLIKLGAASYVKGELENSYHAFTMTKEDMDLLQSDKPKPNARLEALFRPFDEAVTYNSNTREYTKPEWFVLMGVLEQAGYDLDEPGLAEAIMPENAYINAIMDFKEPAGTEPA